MLIQDQNNEISIGETSPDAQDHGIENNDETAPYEEISNSSQNVYAELNRNQEDKETSDNTYQKLLKRDSDYVIPNDVSSHEVVTNSSSSVYAELNRNQEDENESDNTYQKLLNADSDYVVPNDGHGETSYEELGKKKSPPGYAELDQTKRETDDDASYQKLQK